MGFLLGGSCSPCCGGGDGCVPFCDPVPDIYNKPKYLEVTLESTDWWLEWDEEVRSEDPWGNVTSVIESRQIVFGGSLFTGSYQMSIGYDAADIPSADYYGQCTTYQGKYYFHYRPASYGPCGFYTRFPFEIGRGAQGTLATPPVSCPSPFYTDYNKATGNVVTPLPCGTQRTLIYDPRMVALLVPGGISHNDVVPANASEVNIVDKIKSGDAVFCSKYDGKLYKAYYVTNPVSGSRTQRIPDLSTLREHGDGRVYVTNVRAIY